MSCIRDAVARHLRCICTAADDGASGSDDGDFRFFHSGLVCPKNRARKGSPSRAGESFLPHKDGKRRITATTIGRKVLPCNVKRIGLSQAGNKNGDAGNRGSRAGPAAPAKKAREPRAVDLHTEFLSMRSDGTVEGHWRLRRRCPSERRGRMVRSSRPTVQFPWTEPSKR